MFYCKSSKPVRGNGKCRHFIVSVVCVGGLEYFLICFLFSCTKRSNRKDSEPQKKVWYKCFNTFVQRQKHLGPESSPFALLMRNIYFFQSSRPSHNHKRANETDNIFLFLFHHLSRNDRNSWRNLFLFQIFIEFLYLKKHFTFHELVLSKINKKNLLFHKYQEQLTVNFQNYP